MNQDDNLEHMEYLLSKDVYLEWLNDNAMFVYNKLIENDKTFAKQVYLKEHGLPLDSVIKDL